MKRTRLLRLLLVSAAAAILGCDTSTNVKLADAPPYTPPPPKKVEDMTPKERQRLGGTAGLKFDQNGNLVK